MKSIFILPILLLSMLACQSQKNDPADTATAPESQAKVYGQALRAAETAKPVEEVPGLLQQQDSVYLTLRGEALTSCTKKGCWMTVALPAGEDMRVTFKDYGFFVPKDLNGEQVVMEGVLKRKISSVEEQRHYAEDAGRTAAEIQAIQLPDTAYAFEAVGVLIYPLENK